MDSNDDETRRDEAAPLLGDAQQTSPSAPAHDWWTELSLIARYTVPLVATYLLQYSFSVITTTTAGHLSPDDLAAAAIGVTTMSIAGLALYEGMATALDTLCAQAYGAGNKAGVGLHVQRMLILMAIVTVPVGAIWISSPAFLTLILKQNHLAVKAGSFLRVSLLGIPGYASFEALKRFLQAQGDFNTGMIVLVICAPVNALLSWLFAFRLGMGLEGAALGAAAANTLRPTLLLVCIYFKKSTHECWPGFTHRAFQSWGPMVRLSAAGSAVTLAEWAAFEIITVSTSYMSTMHLAAQTILTTTSIVMWHIPFSLGVAVSTRIGHLIGGGHVAAARRITILYGILFVALGFFNGAVLFLFRNYIGPFYTSDESVRRIVANTMLAVAAFQVVDSIVCGCNGVLRGLARQSVGAWVVFFVNYFAAVPIAVWLELGPLHLGLNGVWSGIIGGSAVIAAVEVIYMIRVDWRGSVETVKSRED
ncbi:mate-domain-containing protein [Fusarium tricinctum]|jgi:MATE family multidrug resistance protein|uniref:Mate-domain-containing protein n=1 Tax=Fusarium tricinctum TaxID=61284 RepID=A0A8K0S0A0_9HYPO|nr:mate-domain-containing protein [Fusarium tricinctum]